MAAIPPTLTLGAGAGSGATGGVSGNDSDGIISVTTGIAPTLGSVIASLVFNEAFANAPNQVTFTPANVNAAAANANVWVPSTSLATTGFDLKNTAIALLPSLTFTWYFKVAGNG